MHMADALIAPAVAGTMYVSSGLVGGYCIKRIPADLQGEKKLPLMGVLGAFVFAAQMINFTIPGTGASGHLIGGLLLSAVLGPYASFLVIAAVLLIQCLLFGDGGILAYGCNLWNMGFYSCILGGVILWPFAFRKGITKGKIFAAAIVGGILSIQAGALSLTLETMVSGVTKMPFDIFAGAMQSIHLVIGIVEGLITAAVLVFLYEARPELFLWAARREEVRSGKQGRLAYGKTLLVLILATVIMAGGLSFAASALPDGLEWSLEKAEEASQ